MSELSSVFARQIFEFISYKRALGMKYMIEERYMKMFDRWCSEQQVTYPILTQQLVEKWTYKRPSEKPKTHSNRLSIIREFAKFLNQSSQNAYVCMVCGSINASTFTPYIFSQNEIMALFKAADSMQKRQTPYIHIVIPAALRVLYGCGLRTCELRNLKKEDMDWENSVFVIRNSKNGKDRLVPFSKSLAEYLQNYYEQISVLCPYTDYLFPNSNGEIFYARKQYIFIFADC
ncbi:MAG: tyrosine-type recombinase/integrase [Eubacterium sp.]|nr:tyrosine-type recombinase/integrase [Eubacterium sp.]